MLTPGGFLRRVAASLLDLVLVLGLAQLAGNYLGPVLGFDPEQGLVISLVHVVGWLGYNVLLSVLFATTVGKRALGLCVVRSDGRRLGFGRGLCRHLCWVLSSLLLGAGFLLFLFRGDRRALHDLLCDTVVVRVAR